MTTPHMSNETHRRVRRVADADRKRGKQACTRCKSRKNRCIPTLSGVCQRCAAGAYRCEYESQETQEVLPTAPSSVRSSIASSRETPRAAEGSVPSAGFLAPGSAIRQARHSFKSRLRESFLLGPETALDERDLARSDTCPPLQQFTADQRHRAREAARAFPPREVANFLVGKCVSHGTDSFFYFDQEQTMRQIDHFYTQTSPLRSDISFVCFVLALFALGSQWTSLDVHSNATAARAELDPGHRFYVQARALLPDLLDRPTLASVQAAFLLGVYTVPTNSPGAGYIYLGLAVRQAVSLGFHLEEAQPAKGYDQEVQRRLFWSIYSLDRTYSVKLGRPRSIEISAITVSLPRAQSRFLVNQKFNNIEHQIANAKLALLLDRVADFGTWSAEQQAQFDKLDHDLRAWKRHLPQQLLFDQVDMTSPEYRAVFHLHLNYHFAYIAMGKLSILSMVRSRLNAVSDQAQPQPVSSPPRTIVAQAAVKAAQKILRLFEKVHASGQLARFSYTDFQGCSVATVITLLAGILGRELEYASRISFGLDCLKLLAGPHVNVNIGVHFVETLKSVADECYAALHQTDHARKSFVRDNDGDIQRWSEWLASVGPGDATTVTPVADVADGQVNASVSDSNVHAAAHAYGGPQAIQHPNDDPSGSSNSDTAVPDPSDALLPSELWNPLDHDLDMMFNLENCNEEYLVSLTGMDGLNDLF